MALVRLSINYSNILYEAMNSIEKSTHPTKYNVCISIFPPFVYIPTLPIGDVLYFNIIQN